MLGRLFLVAEPQVCSSGHLRVSAGHVAAATYATARARLPGGRRTRRRGARGSVGTGASLPKGQNGGVGLAMVDAGQPVDQAWIDAGGWSVEIGASTYPAVMSLRPLYDSANERIRM